LGFAIQLSTDAEEVEPAMILDRTIAQYSGRKMSEVLDPAAREELKNQLKDKLNELYGGEVLDVWLTDYVAQ
jgi:flagellar FliL protein